MTVSDLYSQTLSSLTATRLAMLSPDWQTALDLQTPDVRLQSSLKLLQVQQAIAALSNASLSDIAQEMNTEEEDIRSATSDLAQALKDLTKVQNVIGTITSLLTTVAKIVPLV